MRDKIQQPDEMLVPLRPPEECSVLIVDDEPSVIEIISFFLDKQGYHILTAEDGQQALETVSKEMPDVIVMDVKMPNLDGIETCRRLKHSPATRFLPVVLVTAKGDTATRIQGKDAGADDFLDKPVNELELATRVRTLLRGKLLYEEVAASNRDLERRVGERTTELRDAYERLKALERVKSDIISNISHELRTPLQHIKSSVSLLTMGGLPSSENELIRNTVNSAVDSLVRLVEDMINLGEGASLRMERVVISDSIRDAVSQCRTGYRSRAENILTELEADLPPVEADARAITRVVYHMLDNALKFSEGGTPVSVSARREGQGKVRVAVQDYGIGIPEEDREQVFEAFYQADSSSTRRYPGVGLGLSLVQIILDGHGVEAHLKSQEGKGTTIWFDLQAVNLD